MCLLSLMHAQLRHPAPIYIYVYMHICIYVYYMHMYMYITFGWVAKVDKGFGQLVSVQGGREYKVLINL